MALAGFLVTAQTITGSHSDFPALIVASNFTNANANALDGTTFINGGGNVIVYTDATKTTRVPIGVVSFVTGGTPEVIVWAKHPTMQTSATFWVEADSVQVAQPPVTDAFGRNAVWQDFYFASHDMVTDVTGNGTIIETGTPEVAVGPFGSDARDYDGSTENAVVGNSNSLTGGISVLCWFDYDTDNFPRLLTARDSGDNGLGIALHDTQNAVYVFASDDNNATTWGNLIQSRRSSPLVAGWQFIGASASATDVNGDKSITASLYNNAVMSTSGTETWFKPDTSEFNIASRGSNASRYNGRLGGLCGFYNGELSQDALQTYRDNQVLTSTFWVSSDWTTGGGSVSVSDSTATTKSSSNADSIQLVGKFNVLDSTATSKALSNADGISLVGSIIVDDSASQSNSSSNQDTVTLVGQFIVLDQTNTSKTKSNNDNVTLGAIVNVNDSLSASKSVSNGDIINLVGKFQIADKTATTKTESGSDNVAFSSLVSVSDSESNSNTTANNDSVFLVGEFLIADRTSNSNASSNQDSILLVGEFIINDSQTLTNSLSNKDTVLIGTFSFEVLDETNINNAELSNNITIATLSTNINS